MAISNTTDRFNGVVASLAIKVRCVVGIEEQVDDLDGISNPYSGINIADGDRVLLVGQTDEIENGVWDTSEADPWTRAFDWDGNRDVEKGSTVWAGQSGGLDKLWQVQTEGTILPGSTAVQITLLFDPEASSGGQPNPIKLPEIAGADIDVPGEGQIWVRDDVPNVLMFTSDDGTDHNLLANPIVLAELAASGASVAAFGQIWVRDDAPNVLVFTDDTGADTVLGAGGGGGGYQPLGLWRYRTETTSNPSSGRLQFDDLTIDNATEMYVNQVNDGGTDMTAFLDLVETDDLIYLQLKGDASQFVAIQVGNPTKSGGAYTFPIQIVEGQGSAPSQNSELALVIAKGAGASGGTPAGANEEIQYNDNGAFGASPRLRWDVSEGSLDIDARDAGTRDGAVHVSRIQEDAVGLRIDSINGNTTTHKIWVSNDSGGEGGWNLVDDHTGSLRTIFWEDDFGEVFIEFETAGGGFDAIRMGGHTGSEKVFVSFGDEIFSIRNGATLYFEELASANPDVGTEGQVWVRSDNPQTLMFTDDDGTDIVIAGSPTGTYTRDATVVEDRTLLASASATTINNNNVLAALIADLTTRGIIG